MFLDALDRHPERAAAFDGERRRSFAELAERAFRFAHHLRHERGLREDEHIAVGMANRVEYLECLLGAVFAGVWITPVSTHLRPPEIEYLLSDSGSKLFIADDAMADRASAADVPTLRVGRDFDDALRAASPTRPALDGRPGANMIYTSGTTGRPKGVQRRRADTLGAALDGHAAYGRKIGLDGDGGHLLTGPMHHAAPLMFAVYALANGAPIHILPRWDSEAALHSLATDGIAHTHMVPTMFHRLLQLPEATRAAFDPSRLRTVLHGAAPISTSLKRRMIDWWGPVLVEYWGATEAGVQTLIDSREWLERPGSVGRSVPPYEVFAVDDDGRRLPADEVGELFCCHADRRDVFAYHGDAEKTAAAHLAPGLFTIGDIGRVDADGFVYLADRRSHTIISGGVNIYPAEIEHALAEHPAVADVAVFGVPDEDFGESVKAAVELHPGRDASPELARELIAFARERIAGYKVPRSIDFEAKLPREDSGKLYVRELRDRYWKDRERAI